MANALTSMLSRGGDTAASLLSGKEAWAQAVEGRGQLSTASAQVTSDELTFVRIRGTIGGFEDQGFKGVLTRHIEPPVGCRRDGLGRSPLRSCRTPRRREQYQSRDRV